MLSLFFLAVDNVPEPPPAPPDVPDALRLGGGASFLLPLLVLAAGVALGYAFFPVPVSGPAAREEALRAIRQQLDTPLAAQLAHILVRNVPAYLSLVGGAFTAGIATVVGVGSLGVWIGWRLVHAPLAHGVAPALLAALLLPHGVVELAALLLGAGAGLRGGALFLAYLRTGQVPSRPLLRPVLRQAAAGLALLVCAALLEVCVTPAVVRPCLPQ